MRDSIRQVTKSEARFTWVKAEFLAAQKVWAWSDMPVWMPAQGEVAGFSQISIQKALGKGLTFRSFSDTTQATLEWIREQPPERQELLKAGITAQHEAELLAAWHAPRRVRRRGAGGRKPKHFPFVICHLSFSFDW